MYRKLSYVKSTPDDFKDIPGLGDVVPKLSGQDLLDKMEIMRTWDILKGEMCLCCGYCTPEGRPAYTEFYEALLDAKMAARQAP